MVRELSVALLMGVVCGCLASLFAFAFGHDPAIGLALGLVVGFTLSPGAKTKSPPPRSKVSPKAPVASQAARQTLARGHAHRALALAAQKRWLEARVHAAAALRWHGEAALLQQATNFQEAHNDNLKTIAFADGLWVMFDYNRGYAPDIESSGCMDLFRLPKFSRDLFRSQRPPDEDLPVADSGPMVFIASYWTPESSTDVRVFSNCDEVELRLNGTLVERRGPDEDRLSTHIKHPPFTFQLNRFEPGALEAIAGGWPQRDLRALLPDAWLEAHPRARR